MSSSRIAEEVSGLRRGDTLQKPVKAGARNQWRCDSKCVVGVLHFAMPGMQISSGDLADEPLEPDEVQKAMRLEIEYFRKMGVYKKVPAIEFRDGGHNALGVRWVDAKRAEGRHRPRLHRRHSLPRHQSRR